MQIGATSTEEPMTTSQPATQGVHHVGLTVPNLQATQRFFIDALGFKPVGDVPDYPAAFMSDGVVMITLWQAKDPANAVAFDRRNVIGLHHLALKVAGVSELDRVHERLSARDDVEIEFSPEPLRGGPTRHMICAVPGGVRVEFIAPVQN